MFVLDLTGQDFLGLSKITVCVFDKRILRSTVLFSDVRPNSAFLGESLSGKHSWLNAGNAKTCRSGFGMLCLLALKVLCRPVSACRFGSRPCRHDSGEGFQVYSDCVEGPACPSVA